MVAKMRSQREGVEGLRMVEHNLMQELQETEHRVALAHQAISMMLQFCAAGSSNIPPCNKGGR
eukprot:12903041-Prorocentrum_lima.AAC.1